MSKICQFLLPTAIGVSLALFAGNAQASDIKPCPRPNKADIFAEVGANTQSDRDTIWGYALQLKSQGINSWFCSKSNGKVVWRTATITGQTRLEAKEKAQSVFWTGRKILGRSVR